MADPIVRAGDLISIAGAFTTTAGTPADPTTLTFTWEVTEPFSGNVLLAPVVIAYPDNRIVKDSVGNYHINLDTTGHPGRLVWTWSATGALQAISDGEILIRKPLAPV